MLFEPKKPEVELGEVIPARIADQAQKHPESTAIVFEDQRISWQEFWSRVCQVANGLQKLGLGKGDKVCILASPSPAYLEVFIGALTAGCCLVPLSTMASPEALERMVNDSDSKVFFLSQSMQALADPFSNRLGGLVEGGKIGLDFAKQDWREFEGWKNEAPTSPLFINIAYEDPFNIIYSSGTTGVPKGILHNHLMRNAQVLRGGDLGYDQEAVTILSTPLYSNTTIVSMLPALSGGGTIVLMKKFDAREFVSLVEREKVTHAMLVPVQYKRIMDLEGLENFDLSSMKMKFSTSAPLRRELKEDVLQRFPGGLIEYYGLTEGGCTTVLACHEYPEKLASVGQPVPGGELRFIDEAGQEVPLGETGEICGRSSMMMQGYFNRDDLTEEMLWRDEKGRTFFKTGDMGYQDEDGFVFLSDRKKDMIISGGLNIYATDLEIVLGQHPDLDDVAVIGVPSEEWGETPLGLVVLKPGHKVSEADILTWANEKLGKSQRLSAVEFRDKLPRSSIGKILKRELREPYLAKS